MTYVQLELLNVKPGYGLKQIVEEINLSFNIRAQCEILSEDYKKNKDNITVTLELEGDSEKIKEAAKESQWMFIRESSNVTSKISEQ